MTDFETHPAGTADLVKRLRNAAGVDQMEYPYPMLDEAADHIEQLVATVEQLEATLTRANAATAAAYEVAAQAIDADGEYIRSIGLSKRIRDLTTPDQTAALDKLIAEAVKPYVEALENIAQEASVPIHTWQNGINFKRMYEGWRKIATERIDAARAILAAIEPQPDPRDEAIKGLVDAATEALSELEAGGKTLQTVHNLRAAIAAAKAVQHG